MMVKHRVLVVDDYPDSAETTCTLLTLLGHECRFAVCGRDALAQAAQWQPDVAILDIGLPDVSGFDLARELRKQLAGKPLYLAAVTGWGQREDRDQALAAGFDQHFLKPADRATLSAIMERADRMWATAPARPNEPDRS
jgi:CheY-like chemotaxis protein